MKKIFGLLSVITLGLLASCEKQDNVNQTSSNGIQIITNQGGLRSRIDFTNSGNISINNPTGKSSETSQFSLTQIAEIKAPLDNNGVTLQATHVCINGNLAYVSYNNSGENYSGAIDLIDVTDPYSPKLLMSAMLPGIDVTGLSYANNKLFIAGALDIYTKAGVNYPSITMTMQLNNGMLTSNVLETDLEGYVTTGIAADATSSYAVTGDNGSVYKINNAGQVVSNVKVDDLREVSLYQDKVVTLSGKKGINIYNSSDLTLTKSFSNWTDKAQGAKRTIDFYGQSLLVSEGFDGLGIYDINSGNKTQTISLVSDSSLDPNDVVTNAVSVNGDYVFAANGAQGLNVYNAKSNFSSLGTVGIAGSSNYVKSSGDFIYVASGKGGLKIIKIENNQPKASQCSDYPVYNGTADLVTETGADLKYSGSTALNSILIRSNSTLVHCGSLSVQTDLTVSSNSIMTIKGSMSQGKYQSKPSTTLIVRSNATLNIDGSVVIWGDLDLNSNCTLNFSPGSSITIYGKVTKSSNLHIVGTFTDTEHKL